MEQFGIMMGKHKKSAFEGWFLKIDDIQNDLMLSIIWGYTTHEKTGHAFLQFTTNIDHQTHYISYPLEELEWKSSTFHLKIGNNFLSEKKAVLDFTIEGRRVQGVFEFGKFSEIKKGFLKPNIMGWLTYFPNECNHSITSMHHNVNGKLRMGEKKWEIVDADGYIEKDWGTSFPEKYVWLQANNWENSRIVFSYATVPMLGKYRKGFFLLLQHEGIEYLFSTIEGSRLIDFNADSISFWAKIRKGNTEVSIKGKQRNPVPLASPSMGEMNAKIKESLDGDVEIILLNKGKKKIELKSNRASIDVHFL